VAAMMDPTGLGEMDQTLDDLELEVRPFAFELLGDLPGG
jgi:hypothetical protein